MIKKRLKEKINSVLIIFFFFILPSFIVFPTVSSSFPNYDINMDGVCNLMDLVQISIHFGQAGSPGWIREDVDKNGKIRVLDMTLTSNHYGESGWNSTNNARIQKWSICYSGHISHNDGCREFLATHFDLIDTESYYPQYVQQVKNYAANLGRNITVLGYYNTLTEPTYFPDWNYLNDGNHEAYFLHDVNGDRIYQTSYSTNPVMNPASAYSGWNSYYAQRAYNLLVNYPGVYDGIFADCVYKDITEETFTKPFSSWDFNNDGVGDGVSNWPNYIYSLIQGTQNAIGDGMLMPNAWRWTEYCQNITHIHFWENFIHDEGTAYNANGYSITTSLNAINLLHTQAELGNKIATHSGCLPDSAHEAERKQWMLYCYACLAFAVVDTNKAYFDWMFYGQDSSNGWYSEMDMVLGQPVDQDYYHVTGTPYVYARDFTNYYVAANLNLLGTGSVTFNLWGQTITLPPKQAVFIQK